MMVFRHVLVGVLGIFLLVSNSAAQNERPLSFDAPSIHVSYGLYGAQWLMEGLSEISSDNLNQGFYEPADSEWPLGPINVSFLAPVGEWFRVGAEYSYSKFNKDWRYRPTIDSDHSIVVFTNSYHGLMARLDILWVHSDFLQVYSSGAVGGYMLRQTGLGRSSTEIGPAYHLTAAGARIGGGISVFAEIGYGFRGLLIAGIAVAF